MEIILKLLSSRAIGMRPKRPSKEWRCNDACHVYKNHDEAALNYIRIVTEAGRPYSEAPEL